MKRNNIILTILLTLIVFTSDIFAYDSSSKLDLLFLKIEDVYKSIRTLRVNYIQNIIFEATNEKQEISGILFFYRPNNIYILQTCPTEQKIYIDDKSLKIYDIKNSQVIINSWKNISGIDFSIANIINLGNNLSKIKKTNTLIIVEESSEHILLRISPLNQEDVFVDLYISKTTFHPIKSILQFPGTKIETIFEDYIVNLVLDKKTFKLNVSDDVEIIRLD